MISLDIDNVVWKCVISYEIIKSVDYSFKWEASHQNRVYYRQYFYPFHMRLAGIRRTAALDVCLIDKTK